VLASFMGIIHMHGAISDATVSGSAWSGFEYMDVEMPGMKRLTSHDVWDKLEKLTSPAHQQLVLAEGIRGLAAIGEGNYGFVVLGKAGVVKYAIKIFSPASGCVGGKRCLHSLWPAD
jgi:hypothetical protein